MKRFLDMIAAVAALTMALVSCKSDEPLNYSNTSFGTLRYENGFYLILTDQGENLYITNTSDFDNATLSNYRGRVFVGYNILGDIDPSKSYYRPDATANKNIELQIFNSFVRSDVKVLSKMDETDIISVGQDCLTLGEVSVTPNGYVSGNLQIYYSPAADIVHKISMVYDDTQTDGCYHIWLMHNAYNDIGQKEIVTFFSFDLNDVVLPADVTSATVVLHWDDYTSISDFTPVHKTKTFQIVR